MVLRHCSAIINSCFLMQAEAAACIPAFKPHLGGVRRALQQFTAGFMAAAATIPDSAEKPESDNATSITTGGAGGGS